ncbi:MAG: tripartite tricarboxylate transporter substrate binding protein [Betaproteobacteria bacterium]|nr:tripartite tricarboxylate transporter substrate binding protein [Betaproteobacteria bacterium]
MLPLRGTFRMLGVAALCLLATGALAAGYPDRPVRLVVPSPPGGGTDTTTRMIAPKLSEILGQQLVIDNRGGAAGNIGAEIVARAAPDGYTLLACIASHTSNPAVMKKVGYDLERDFAPISLMVKVPNILISHPSLPAKNIKELIAFARARPGQLQFASAGLGSAPHLMMELFASMAGLKMIHVPYKGAGPALTDVIAGHVPIFAGNILSTLPHVKAGRVRAYGVTSARRSTAAPEIPAIAEGGLTGYEAVTWFGLLVPAGTPREIVMRLHGAVVGALEDPAVKQRFINDGAEPKPSSSPEEFREFMRAETKKWAKVIRDSGMKRE